MLIPGAAQHDTHKLSLLLRWSESAVPTCGSMSDGEGATLKLLRLSSASVKVLHRTR